MFESSIHQFIQRTFVSLLLLKKPQIKKKMPGMARYKNIFLLNVVSNQCDQMLKKVA